MSSTSKQKYGIPERFLNEFIHYCSNNANIEKVLLFGSRARGDFRFNSDIDLAFYTTNINHSEQNIMEYMVREISTHLKVDIVFMDRLSKEELIKKIKRDGVTLYEQGTALRKA
ncbi:nucleotidyltransferase domain-containing protein [Radiobacillus kanasensis]|uniref:nucleotidyltransferase domain-containing protein n=1 Tax=Radiobacillus kanasensis TaxID=2844358 RepID=UPI001E472D76|nr:nucleotidyltransferase domain-containing protein [Radiobacillus kanasensis]UFU00233.1 nucleotidyltransferase domain-containing protein [Radiobacillus kanasensis]